MSRSRLWFTVIAASLLCVAFLLQFTIFSTSRDSWGAQNRYDYLHFMAGDCMSGSKEGKGVIDLRNGNVWCVPYDGSAPKFEGTLNLSAIPEKPPTKK